MKSIAKRILLLAAILAPVALGAQTKNDLPDFEITGNVRSGLNSLMYKVDGTASKPSLGLGGGIGFNWFFKPAWSFSTGLEYSLYNGSIDLDEVASAQLRDYDGNFKAVYHHTLKNFSEKQRMGALQVPVMFKWMTPLKVTSPHRFYIGFGAKMGFNINGSYKQEVSALDFEYRDGWYYQEPEYSYTEEFPGFKTGKNDLKFGLMNVTGSLELGFRWKLGKGPVALYTGVYVDAGIPNVFPKVSDNPLVYSAEDDMPPIEMAPRRSGGLDDAAGGNDNNYLHNSILQGHKPHSGKVVSPNENGYPEMEWNTPTSHYSKHLTTLSSGIVLKLAFGIRKKKPVPAPVIPVFVPEPEPEEAEPVVEPEEEPAKMEVKELEIKEIPVEIKRSMMKMSNALFEFDKFNLTDEVVTELDKVTAWLIDNPDLNVAVEGHTDSIGSDEYNQRLSESRAKAVMEYFIAHGVKAERLSYVGHGESMPIADNATEEGRRLNRRVELKIVEE